jgi:hypothetical protein
MMNTYNLIAHSAIFLMKICFCYVFNVTKFIILYSYYNQQLLPSALPSLSSPCMYMFIHKDANIYNGSMSIYLGRYHLHLLKLSNSEARNTRFSSAPWGLLKNNIILIARYDIFITSLYTYV